MIFCAESRPGTLPTLLLAIVTLWLFGCGKASESPPRTTTPVNTTTTSSIPPFATREPERYSATRIITTTRNGSTSQVERTSIARDGVNRREEYQSGAGTTLVYLETGNGTFMLLPAKKIFADVRDTSLGPPLASDQMEFGLEQARREATYEVLGTEQVNGRGATKYRVMPTDETNPSSATLIWIDDVLRMPVRTESRHDEQSSLTVVMELRDIKTEVDTTLFGIPGDYKKVEAKAFRDGAKAR